MKYTPTQLNTAIAEMREPKPKNPDRMDDGTMSDGGNWFWDHEDGWIARYFTSDLNDAILLFRELPDPTLDYSFNGNDADVAFQKGKGFATVSAPEGKEALAIAKAWYQWKKGETIEIEEE